MLVLGLAPAAHGGNRTGRIFTGDRSGDWLFASLYRTGFANQPTSVSRDDGLALRGCYITAAVRCAPPANRPLPAERDNCLPYLVRELPLLGAVQVIVCLGGFAWEVAFRVLAALEIAVPRPRPKFGHGAEVTVDRFTLLGCYHPSQQNTFTGKLTEQMTDDVFARAREMAGLPESAWSWNACMSTTHPARPELAALWIADPAARWSALGFEVAGGRLVLGGVTVHLEASGRGIARWALSGIDPALTEIDGLPTETAIAARAPRPSIQTARSGSTTSWSSPPTSTARRPRWRGSACRCGGSATSRDRRTAASGRDFAGSARRSWRSSRRPRCGPGRRGSGAWW